MILHAQWRGKHVSDRPVLVWLHGFLGSGAEWLSVQHYFPDSPQLSIDLPAHGGSRAQRVAGFEQLSERLTATLRFHRVKRYWLIGYSLGGRVALYHACRHGGSDLLGLTVEGGHVGLTTDEERQQRRENDRAWAKRFRQQPLERTLDGWYRQPVFADLREPERQALIALRRNNHPQALAEMLMATSLAVQPDLRPDIAQLTCPLQYLCGEQDRRFSALAEQADIPYETLPAAGHNAHRANPQAFARRLAQRLPD
ncbi:2-succinyl-6-hydroxy-2,4-cyclohexadiene-1-carboxylate synthase [Erwinia tasmaniensis]|uniref:2-succinyl-6-hydroxy-2, 4-cyclohexadiene-1-carboxylate synthase n=1 Tax=Erwinia tasmaniensis TaxID=338565 RepID=UPI003A4D8881